MANKRNLDNALTGIRLLLAAQILTVALVVFSAASIIDEKATLNTLLALAAGVLFIIGMVYGKKDEDSFRSALICTVLSFVLSVLIILIVAFSEGVALILYFPLSIAITICGLLANYFILDAIRNLADRRRNYTVSSLATWTWRIILIGTLIDIFIMIITRTGAYTSASTVVLIKNLLNISINTLFLVTLCFAERMLA